MEGLLKKDRITAAEMMSVARDISNTTWRCVREIERLVEDRQSTVGWLSRVIRVGLMFFAFAGLSTNVLHRGNSKHTRAHSVTTI